MMRDRARRIAVAGLLAGAGVLCAVPASAVLVPEGAAPVRAATPPPGLPADCHPNPKPPPTEYGVVARIETGSIDAGALQIQDMDVSLCSVLRLVPSPSGTSCPVSSALVIPADGVKANALKAVLAIIPNKPLEVPVVMRARPTTSVISCDGSSSGGFKAELTVGLEGRASLFGLQCAIPFSGVAKAVITGPLLTPPYQGQATLKGQELHRRQGHQPRQALPRPAAGPDRPAGRPAHPQGAGRPHRQDRRLPGPGLSRPERRHS